MPVRIEEFESGDLPQGPSVPEQVLTYLYTNRDKAFTRSEIATGIDEEDSGIDPEEWDAMAPNERHPSERETTGDE